MRTDEANKVRTELAEQRKKYCLEHRWKKQKTLARELGISVRQVQRYLGSPSPAYKKRKEAEKLETQNYIRQGLNCEQIRDNVRITHRQYYYYREQMKAK